MEKGDIKEAIERLEQADEVVKHRLTLNQCLGEQQACEDAREHIGRAVTRLLPYSEDC